MNKIYITTLLGIILMACSGVQGTAENKKLKPDTTFNFSDDVPEHSIEFPKIKSDNYDIYKKMSHRPGEPPVTEWLLEGKNENGPFMYFIAHNKIPKALQATIQGQPEQINTALQGMLVGSAEKLGGFDFNFTATEYNGHPGMYSKCKVFNGAGMIKSAVYLIEEDIFIISGGGKGIEEENVDTFLSSFKLTE